MSDGDDDIFIHEEAELEDDVSGDGFGGLEFGLAFAAASLIADQHADAIREAISDLEYSRYEDSDVPPPPTTKQPDVPQWDLFYGQERLKRTIQVAITSAKSRRKALPHILLASGFPGVGKTHLAKLIADEMGVNFTMMVPPFSKESLHAAVRNLGDQEIIFIDEIHKMADGGAKGAETLLHIMEEKRIYSHGQVIDLADITIIGATTDPDKLPETIIDRFELKPFFEAYSFEDLAVITGGFAGELGVYDLDLHTAIGIAKACRGTPRVARAMVTAVRDLTIALDRQPTLDEVLEYMGTDPDGMTRQHKRYLEVMYTHFREVRADGRVEYIAGEDTLRAMLRETKNGLHRLERYLIELGYVDRSTRGRRLTPSGVEYMSSHLQESTHAGNG